MQQHLWDAKFTEHAPWFAPLQDFAEEFKNLTEWPTLTQLNQVLQNSGPEQLTDYKLVPQNTNRKLDFAEQYEPRIYLNHEIQTRIANWHDFINYLIWLRFPAAKIKLNQLQYQDALQQYKLGSKQRTNLQNILAQFDECGVGVLCSDPELINYWQHHQWQKLFFDNAVRVSQSLRFIIFGHGLLEKSLQPYIGITGKAIVIVCEQAIMNSAPTKQYQYLDGKLTEYFIKLNESEEILNLLPLPILGVPGWYPQQNIEFYNNREYFRAKNN